MTDPIRISVNLTSDEAKAAQGVYDKLVEIDLFKDVPQAAYGAIEKFVKAVNLELYILEMAARKGFEWGEKCGFCGHSSKEHAQGGVGLCSAESCNCFKMINSGKPF